MTPFKMLEEVFVGLASNSLNLDLSTGSLPLTPLMNANLNAATHLVDSNSFEVRNLSEGQLVYQIHTVPEGLYYLKTGCVKLVTKRQMTRGRMASPEFVTQLIGPGEYFGYRELLTNKNYQNYAKVLRASEVHVYSSGAGVFVPDQVLSKNLMLQMTEHLDQKERTAELHYLASVQERIAHQLIQLSDRFGVDVGDQIHLNLKLTRNELAQLAGTINESLSRHLTEFSNEGILELRGRDIIVKNRQALLEKSGNV